MLVRVNNFSGLLSELCLGNARAVSLCMHWIHSLHEGKYEPKCFSHTWIHSGFLYHGPQCLYSVNCFLDFSL